MAASYPPPAPTISGDYLTIHTLLQSPTLIARRIRTIAEQRFIADALLTARFNAIGGAVQYWQSEPITTVRGAEQVTAGSEYPMSPMTVGDPQVAAVVKWGQDVPITDESIKRTNIDPVSRAFAKLVNQLVRTVDAVAMSIIETVVTQSTAAVTPWATATGGAIFRDVMQRVAAMRALGLGLDPDTIALDDVSYANAMAAFVDAGYVPRETDVNNPAISGAFPSIGGLRWLASPHMPTTGQALIVDSTQLGGMADEQLGGPGYAGAIAGVETKSIREDENDGWRLRARRVCVPVVVEPRAAWKLAGI
ncbi:MAG: hypothetical protein DLM56_08200 [Pseudonocardiales bacterium]|nr:MAG: hypothetical protein DLM56_08200 [Pseudonocardiales bacterium]